MSSIVAHSVLYPSVSRLCLKDLDLTSAGRYCEILGSFSWTVRGGWSLPYTESACCVDLLTTLGVFGVGRDQATHISRGIAGQ